MGKTVIVIRQRGDHFHASVEGMTGVWAAGNTPDGAIGNLVRTHPEMFGVVAVDYKQ